ncbi:hypothetical protein HMPREF0083_00249 [Aneurinibacillus aneurinilyticus ATCC 12856]|uniref:Uncharacterized protein n=1 Tax=Aneurinibacillus aneurinilyticus ATCC 12856 TaxID=649747 RepID=U1XAU2_ANEAE|nr:hypothetical protein HMPREF0083_00249 [Aneurinibacillus aneurinilyticus ATCC 12856]
MANLPKGRDAKLWAYGFFTMAAKLHVWKQFLVALCADIQGLFFCWGVKAWIHNYLVDFQLKIWK